MIADVALHAPGEEGDQRNHHAHVMLTTRAIEAEGFGGKDRSWNSKELLEDWRESWADHANACLREIEAAREIDHRSLEAQRDEKLDLKDQALERGDDKVAHEMEIEAVELNRDPLPDIGWKAWGLESMGAGKHGGWSGVASALPPAIFGVKPVAGLKRCVSWWWNCEKD